MCQKASTRRAKYATRKLGCAGTCVLDREAAWTHSNDLEVYAEACEGNSACMLRCGSAVLEHRCWSAEKHAERVEHNYRHAQSLRRTSRTLGPRAATHYDGHTPALYFVHGTFHSYCTLLRRYLNSNIAPLSSTNRSCSESSGKRHEPTT